MTLRVVLFAPTQTSMYARLLAHLIHNEDDIDLVGISVRSLWSWRRIRGELRRDGARLIAKVYSKLILGEDAYPAGDRATLSQLAVEEGLSDPSLRHIGNRHEIPLIQVTDLNAQPSELFVRDLRPDIVVFSGGGLIRKNILEIPELGIINCHSGILPTYRGMDVVEWAVLEAQDQPELGLTLHFLDRGVDTGPILLYHHESIRSGDTLASIRYRLEHEMVKLMMNGLRNLRDGTLRAQPQTQSEGRQYFVMHPKLRLAAAERIINLSKGR